MKIPKILVVEDREENLKAAKEFFDSLGKFEVDYATNLEDAKKKLQEEEYFLGIFDLDMPIREGEEIKEKAGLELEEIAKQKENMFYVFYSGGYWHGTTPKTRVYLDGASAIEGVRGQWTETYSKDSTRGWQELYRELIKIGEESTTYELEKEVESSLERYVRYVGKIPSIKPKALIPYIFDKFYEIFKENIKDK